jgi:uncharacterized protein YgbK (DUF1537 family)
VSVLVAVIADDLTGAADTGVQLVRAGYRTAVAFHGSALPPAVGLDAVAADTDSRGLDPEAAAERAARAAAELSAAGILYKKLDSTLRGPVAEELGAALRGSGRRTGILAPAFPPAGRTTENGVQLVDGVPVDETAFARDPTWPVREARLPALLERAGLGPVRVLLALGGRPDPGRVARELEAAAWLVADARDDDDLEALVRSVPDPSAVLWAGSAGLAGALGRVHPGPRANPAPARDTPEAPPLVVLGSANPVIREQVERLVRDAEVEDVAVGASVLAADEGSRSAVERAGAALAAGRAAVVRVTDDGPRGGPDAARRIATALAWAARELDERRLAGGLVLSGGDTAVGVARALGAEGLLVEDELEPGVPLGRLIGPRPLPVVTKAGGFGSPDALVRACRALGGERTAVG